MSLGMNADSGRWISDIDHLRQSVRKILTTPIGTRVERREFGSLVPDLIDTPLNDQFHLLIYAAVATALMQHEPRIKLERVQLSRLETGAIEVFISGALLMDEFYSKVDLVVGL